MPQLQPVTLVNDRPATNVAHVFVPMGMSDGSAMLTVPAGVPIGNKRLALSGTVTSNGRIKRKATFTVPILSTETVGGATKNTVLRTAYATIELSFDPASTKGERGEVVSLVSSLTWEGQTDIVKFFEDLEGLY